jgi:hypothetical protein
LRSDVFGKASTRSMTIFENMGGLLIGNLLGYSVE